MKNPLFIAEVKTQSPFGYESETRWEDLFSLADEVGDMISVHTNPLWGGSMDLIRRAKGMTDKPILAKGIHQDDESIKEALRAGADNVLVAGRTPNDYKLRPFCWIEPYSIGQMGRLSLTYLDVVVWNSRDLGTGEVKTETFDEARRVFEGMLVQASNIRTESDINPRADAIIVGQHLQEFVDRRS